MGRTYLIHDSDNLTKKMYVVSCCDTVALTVILRFIYL